MTELENDSKAFGDTEAEKFLLIIGGTAALGVIAFVASLLLKIPLLDHLFWQWRDVVIGIVATAPLAGFLFWFVKTTNPRFAEFRQSQVKFFAEIGFEFTMPRIILMALGAGIFEELFFRGVLQVWVDRYTPVIVAIILTNILFGMLHWRTAFYALITGFVGAYLGVLFWFTGNLLTPIVTHALYDFIALWCTRDAISRYNATRIDKI